MAARCLGAALRVVGAGGVLAAMLVWGGADKRDPPEGDAAPAASEPAPTADAAPLPIPIALSETATPSVGVSSTQVRTVLADAIARRGYVPSGPVVSVPAGSAMLAIQRGDGADGQRLFIALDERFLGTDWEDASPRGVSNAVAAGNRRFSATSSNEAGRQPVVVTFTWDGTRLGPDVVAPGHCLRTTGC